MPNDDIKETLRAGIEAARRGERTTARRLLEQVTAEDDRNEIAWMWLASVVNTVPERRNCLERVLEINPNNTRAQEAIKRLRAESSASKPAPSASVSEDQRRRAQLIQGRTSPAGQPRDSADALRASARADQTDGGTGKRGGGGVNTRTLLILGGVAAALLLFAFTLASILDDQTQAVTPTSIVVAATLTPTQTFTPEPTITPIPFSEVTPRFTLPPEFTATFTPTPTITPTPTPEPIPLVLFDLLYASLNTGASQPDVYAMQADGSNESFILPSARDMAFSPDGLRVAFIRDVEVAPEEAYPQVFVADFDNLTDATQLTNFRVLDTASPSWSPDAQYLVFASSGDNDIEENLWIIHVSGAPLIQWTRGEGADRHPRWSPVANEIVFSSDRRTPLQSQIFVIEGYNDSTANFEPEDLFINQLTVSGNNFMPDWSPDGERIVYMSDRFGRGDIFIMDREGFGATLITLEQGNIETRSPVMSPDSEWIAFTSNREGDFKTYIMSIDSTVLLKLTDHTRSDQSVVFRPVNPALLR